MSLRDKIAKELDAVYGKTKTINSALNAIEEIFDQHIQDSIDGVSDDLSSESKNTEDSCDCLSCIYGRESADPVHSPKIDECDITQMIQYYEENCKDPDCGHCKHKEKKPYSGWGSEKEDFKVYESKKCRCQDSCIMNYVSGTNLCDCECHTTNSSIESECKYKGMCACKICKPRLHKPFVATCCASCDDVDVEKCDSLPDCGLSKSQCLCHNADFILENWKGDQTETFRALESLNRKAKKSKAEEKIFRTTLLMWLSSPDLYSKGGNIKYDDFVSVIESLKKKFL